MLALRFYIRHVVKLCEHQWFEGNQFELNHTSLLDEMTRGRTRDEPVSIVTFNYDTLVERALGVLRGMKFETPDHLVAGEPYRLFELHGSVDWGRYPKGLNLDPDHRVAESQLFSAAEAGQLDLGPWVREVLPAEDPPRTAKGQALIPAIAVPIAKKHEFECPPNHLDRLQAVLPATRRIIIVGWRAAEVHFTRLMAELIEPGVPGLVVAKDTSEAQETIRALQSAGVRASLGPFEGGFSDFTVQRTAGRFLADTR